MRKPIWQLIEEYAQARVDNSWSGGGDPASVPELELRLSEARQALDDALRAFSGIPINDRCSGCDGRGGWIDPDEGQWVSCLKCKAD